MSALAGIIGAQRMGQRRDHGLPPTPGNEVLMCAQTTSPNSVYFAQSGGAGPIKIGTATNLKKRLDALQIGNPAKLVLMASVAGGVELERQLHARFGTGLIANEWFERDTPGLLETVEHVLRYGDLPTFPEPDPVGWFCETCRWPMDDELGERGGRECWRCLKDLRNRSPRDAGSRLTKSTDLQEERGA